MKARAAAALALAAMVLAGCAPLATYDGPRPAPGVPSTTAANALAPGSRDGARMALGALVPPAAPRARTVILYGDNRPGFRMESQRWEYHGVSHWNQSPLAFARALVAAPLFLVESVVPLLNGPRDVVTVFTGRFTGGGEGRVLKALAREREVDLVISTGDVVTDGRRARLWSDFVRHSRPLRERAPYLAAPGNHERVYDPRSLAGWGATVGAPLADGRLWGALDDPALGARWVFLDSDLLADPHDNRDAARRRAESRAQLLWADSVLAAPARFRFVVLHHPLVSAGHYLRDWNRDGEGESKDNRRRLLAMCFERGVTAVIAGHEHLYQRLWVAGPNGRGFWQVTTGGGGAPLYMVDGRERAMMFTEVLPAGLAVDRASVRTETTYHYCRLTLPPPGTEDGSLPLVACRVSIGGGATPFDSLDLARPPARAAEAAR